MKNLLLVLVCLFAMASVAFAAEPPDTSAGYTDTQRGTYTTPYSGLTDWLNNNDDFYHSHQIYVEPRRAPLGVGTDVVLFQSEGLIEEVTAEGRYDVNNDEASAFLVTKVNAFKAAKNIFKF